MIGVGMLCLVGDAITAETNGSSPEHEEGRDSGGERGDQGWQWRDWSNDPDGVAWDWDFNAFGDGIRK